MFCCKNRYSSDGQTVFTPKKCILQLLFLAREMACILCAFRVSLHPKAHPIDVSFMRPYDSIRRKVLYNSLIEISILMKLVRLVKIYMNNKNYSRAQVGRHLCDMFCIKNGLKQGDALS